MNTLTLNQPQAVDTDSRVLQDRVVAALKAGKKQLKKLSWLFERHPDFIERNLLDRHMGIEVRRLGM